MGEVADEGGDGERWWRRVERKDGERCGIER